MLARQPQYRADSAQLTVAMPPDPEDVRYHDLAKDPQLQAAETQQLHLSLGMLRNGSIRIRARGRRRYRDSFCLRDEGDKEYSRASVRKPNGSTKTCNPSMSCKRAPAGPGTGLLPCPVL